MSETLGTQLSNWAKSMGATASIVSSSPLTRGFEVRAITGAGLERLATPQLDHIWRFLVSRIVSKCEAQTIRRVLDYAAAQPSAVSFKHLQALKQLKLKQLADREALLKKRDDLRRKLAHAQNSVAAKEASFKATVDAVVTAEHELNAFTNAINEKKRKLVLQEAYEKDALEFISVLQEYSALLTGLLELKSRASSAPIQLETVKDICDRVERHYFHPSTGATTDTDTEIVMKIQSLVLSPDCRTLFSSLTALTRAASESLFQSTNYHSREHSDTTPSTSIKKLLHHITRDHVLLYNETKKIQHETEAVLLQIQHILESVQDGITNPEESKTVLAYMNAYSDHEAYKAVSKRLEEYVVDLEDTVHSAHASENHVRELQEKVSELGKELARKHGLIASIMEANSISRGNVLALRERNEQLANTRITQVVPAVNEVATRLHGHVAKEMHALNGIVVSDDVVCSIMNGGVITESVECPKEVLEEIRDALEMPKYLPLDQIPEYVQKMNDAFEFNTKMIQTEKLRAEEHKTRVNNLTSSTSNPLFQPEHLNSTNLKTFVDSVKASSDKYTHEMNQLMHKIETETMQDAQQARLVSARISHVKDMLMKRRG